MEEVTSSGNKLRKGWLNISDKQNVKITVNGIPALSTFNFNHQDNLKFKTYLTQEFLKRGYCFVIVLLLAEHSDKIIDNYLLHFEEMFIHKSMYK